MVGSEGGRCRLEGGGVEEQEGVGVGKGWTNNTHTTKRKDYT